MDDRLVEWEHQIDKFRSTCAAYPIAGAEGTPGIGGKSGCHSAVAGGPQAGQEGQAKKDTHAARHSSGWRELVH